MTKHGVTAVAMSDGSASSEIHIGTCFCGSVQVRATGAPLETGYCHCDSCRSYSAAPLVAYALFAEEQITVANGAELLGGFNKSGMSLRRFCSRCGGHVLTEHPGVGVTDVSATIFMNLRFQPKWHLNYAEAVLPVLDGLPKLEDLPAHVGGSGRMLAE